MSREAKSLTSTLGTMPAPTLAGVLGIVWLMVVASVVAFAPEDTFSLVLALSLPLLPPVVQLLTYCVAQAVRGRALYGSLIAITAALLLSVVFRVRGYDEKGIDAQVVVRLAGIVLLIAIGLPQLFRMFRTDTPLAARLWFAFLSFLLISSAYAQEPLHAFVGALSFFAGFLFVWHFCEVYGRECIVRMLLATSVILQLASLIVYFAVPSLGRMYDWFGDVLLMTTRMQGIQGTANGVGMAAGFSILAALLLTNLRRGYLFWAMIGLFAVCLILSNNRMALVGMLGCGAVLFISRGDMVVRTLILAILGFVALSILYVFNEVIFALLARSGSADEILTATGRIGIWAAAIEIWLDHPLIGLGYNSSLHILHKRADLFEAAAHCHNMFLEVLFSTGLVGLSLLLAATLVTMRDAIRGQRFAEVGIIVFFLIYGLTEPVVAGNANFAVLGFFAAAVLSFMGGDMVPSRAAGPRPETRLRLQPS